jgi:hypothetical protein
MTEDELAFFAVGKDSRSTLNFGFPFQYSPSAGVLFSTSVIINIANGAETTAYVKGEGPANASASIVGCGYQCANSYIFSSSKDALTSKDTVLRKRLNSAAEFIASKSTNSCTAESALKCGIKNSNHIGFYPTLIRTDALLKFMTPRNIEGFSPNGQKAYLGGAAIFSPVEGTDMLYVASENDKSNLNSLGANGTGGQNIGGPSAFLGAQPQLISGY